MTEYDLSHIIGTNTRAVPSDRPGDGAPGKGSMRMGNYRNFRLATYFVAQAAARITQDELDKAYLGMELF